MIPTCKNFPENVAKDLGNESLQRALAKTKIGFPARRLEAKNALPEFDALRDQARDIRNHVLDHLDHYLELFEENVVKQGGKVHWCATAEDARKAVLGICKSADAKTVTKGKSMIGEEIALNDYLEKYGITPIETDLGEYIIQLRKEPPSHIIAPAIHVSKDQVADAFKEYHRDLDQARSLNTPKELLVEARTVLRQRFLAADVGVTGANFLIAETGTTVIVTNEGNGDLTQTLPRIHVVLASIEKIAPTLEDATALSRVLARSITGQDQSVYTTFSTGPRRADDPDGPEEFHVVLLDNGRSKLLGTEARDILRCIRCGACPGHCPVYTNVGGHAYGWVYSGPIGAALTPALLGIEQTRHLCEASTLCGRCEAICPVHIPIPKILRYWRRLAFEKGLTPKVQRRGLGLFAFFAKRPALFGTAMSLVARVLGKRGRFSVLPFAGAWTKGRDFPAPQNVKTFQQLWAERR